MFVCVQCGKPAKLRCRACRVTKYCGKSCQKLDWSFHRTMCSKVVNPDLILSILKKISEIDIPDRRDFILRYAFAKRCHLSVTMDFTSDDSARFMRHELDLCEKVIITPRSAHHKSGTDVLLFLDNNPYLIDMKNIDISSVLSSYEDIRAIPSIGISMAHIAGDNIIDALTSTHKDKGYIPLLQEIITEDGGIIRQDSTYTYTKSYVFRSSTLA
jgi:hypothetical protein